MPTGTRQQQARGSEKSSIKAPGTPKPNLRRSKRKAAVRACNSAPIKLETPPETPRCTPRPETQSRSAATSSASSSNTCSSGLNSSYTGSVPRPNQGNPSCQEQLAGDERQPTVNWDCVSYVVSDQKVHTSYEKPEMGPPCQVDSEGNPIPSKVQAYGKMVTKTVTMTVTTTIATTEILRPGEAGYEASLERQQRQREQGPEEQQRQHKQYRESRQWASGDRTMHENFHYRHHRAAQPAPAAI
ncbi:hypothetical protein Q9L58_007742 [Maublancomyces gigas]|uniref:Uncharacterized protein n=1 Tax=Discina gigas TaxID=1032678 RepID=A0ABR3GBM8_9PEZI